MKTVSEQWDEFAGKVLPPQTSDIQRSEMRRAFYGGAFVMLMDLLDLGASLEGDDDDDAAIALLEARRAEIELFYMALERGEV